MSLHSPFPTPFLAGARPARRAGRAASASPACDESISEVAAHSLTTGALLRRVSVRPRAHCDSPWAVMQQMGFRGVWQTPGERWPFAGVGIAIGRCGGGARAAERGRGEACKFCCSPIYSRLPEITRDYPRLPEITRD